MNFSVVPIAEQHIDGFWAALESVARERRYLALLEAPPPDECRKFVAQNIRQGHPHYVALVADQLVGWCDALPHWPSTRAHAAVLGLGVVAAFRGRGIGTALLRATLECARAVGLTRIELGVRENNERVVALYERFGFVREGIQRNAICIDGKYETLLSMALLLER
ncbi:MAG TPA: GNAT family N-acetyltransferase [Burkholderiales bacterium]|nr:GNAT family N-acetyltransferase [Burkholderiales bacterium]